jgi:hypothetical protein
VRKKKKREGKKVQKERGGIRAGYIYPPFLTPRKFSYEI